LTVAAPPAVEVVPARTRDALAMARLDAALFPSDQSYGLPLIWWYVAAGTHACYVARSADRLAGFVIGSVEAPGEGHVLTIDVARDLQGRGVGSTLLTTLESKLASRGCVRMALEVEVGNDAAAALYERHGYRPLGLVPNYYRTGSDALLMVKEMES